MNTLISKVVAIYKNTPILARFFIRQKEMNFMLLIPYNTDWGRYKSRERAF